MVSQTKSRKIPTRKTLPLFLALTAEAPAALAWAASSSATSVRGCPTWMTVMARPSAFLASATTISTICLRVATSRSIPSPVLPLTWSLRGVRRAVCGVRCAVRERGRHVLGARCVVRACVCGVRPEGGRHEGLLFLSLPGCVKCGLDYWRASGVLWRARVRVYTCVVLLPECAVHVHARMCMWGGGNARPSPGVCLSVRGLG